MAPLPQTTMSIGHRSRRKGIDWLTDGAIGPCVDAFKQHRTKSAIVSTTLDFFGAAWVGGRV